VGRAALGICWVSLPAEVGAGGVEQLRSALADAHCVVLDAPDDVRAQIDPWGFGDAGALDLMRRTKERFDPRGVCSPGVFVGGI
jgi:glycolate oxidase FAD binding subunit